MCFICLNESSELETSQQKTIRKLTSWLKNNRWLFQYYIVCSVNDLPVHQARHDAMQWPACFNDLKFKDDLRRKNSHAGMLFIYLKGFVTKHPSSKNFQHIYISLLSNDVLEFNDLRQYFDPDSEIRLKVMVREIHPSHITQMISSIKSHSFEDMPALGLRKKYSPLNKNRFI